MEKIQTTKEWKPSNGEKVWIKVFSNWSLGSYIGFDNVKNCHIVREELSGGGNILSSIDVLPENANPNNITNSTTNEIPTAEEFLLSKDMPGFAKHTVVKQWMIEFAKLHVEAALKEVSKKKTSGFLVAPMFTEYQVEEILNAYPTKNIK